MWQQQLKTRPDFRKYRSTDGRWTNSSFLSPDDALWDFKKNTDERTEFRWELHSSRTDIDLARKTKCGCHTPLTPEEKRHPERGDLRKHHSAEGDKWSLRPDSSHDLRKHLSDNSFVAGEPKATLKVPEVLPNPKPKCTCPKPKVLVSSDTSDLEDQSKSEAEEKRFEKSPQSSDTSKKVTLVEEPIVLPSNTVILKKKITSQKKKVTTPIQKKKVTSPVQKKKDTSPSLKVTSPEESKRNLRSKWAMKSHFSMPQVDRKDSTWFKAQEHSKSKSLKERHKYSVRRSISPEPDPRQVMRLDNRVVRRLISPEISMQDAKWAPYEGYSPLPNVGIRRRETKRISEIKWVPYDGSPERKDQAPPEPSDEDKTTVTPTHHPPPASTPVRGEDDEERWRFLNIVQPFPLFQGAWKVESPPVTPQKDISSSVWVTSKEPIRITEPSPSPPKKRSIKSRMKKGSRTKTFDEGLAPYRPQLIRSKMLDVKKSDVMKRSLSEDVSRYRGSQRSLKGPHRAKSEEAPKYDPWLDNERDEVREYVTTV